MMLKFKPEDFRRFLYYESETADYCAKTAQLIFNIWIKENGNVVYGKTLGDGKPDEHFYDSIKTPSDTHKAILINIEPIEKCTHPKEKVSVQTSYNSTTSNIMTDFDGTLFKKNEGPLELCSTYKCECGKKVQPKEFEAVE